MAYGIDRETAGDMELSDYFEIRRLFYEREKRLYDILNHNFAALMTIIVNLFSKNKVKIEDFLPSSEPKKKKPKEQSYETMIRNLEGITRSLGGKVIYKNKEKNEEKQKNN